MELLDASTLRRRPELGGCVNDRLYYLKDGITRWIRNWKANGWKTAAKKPVKNKDYGKDWILIA